jgi:hypothetical protein
MDVKFFEEQFSALKGHIDARMGSLERKMDGIEKRMDGLEKRMDGTEKLLQQVWLEVEAIRGDMRLVAEGHMMLGEKFGPLTNDQINKKYKKILDKKFFYVFNVINIKLRAYPVV